MRHKGRWILAALLVTAAVGLFVSKRGGPDSLAVGATRSAKSTRRIVPDDIRIRVEVLNGTSVRGLARRATSVMRDAGFDVVSSGNWHEGIDSSLVLVRTGNIGWGEMAAGVIQPARVEVRADSLRYVDLTIVVGASWRPPPQPFDP